MKQKITPFLWFDRQAEEAMNFYCSIFPDSKIKSIERYPGADERPLDGPPAGMEGKVLTAIFELFGQEFMCLDGGPTFKPSAAVSFYVECETQEEVDKYWNALTKGGDPAMQQCGWVQDKYGFSWQIIPKRLGELLSDSDKTKSRRVMDSMLQMKKIVISELEEAAQG